MSLMIEQQTLQTCCGVHEIAGVSDGPPAAVLYSLETDNGGCTTRNIVFTDITRHRKSRKSGWAFAAFLRKKRFGAVLGPSKAGRNPNTGNAVCVWVWTPNVKAVARWFAAEEKRRDKEEAEE